MRRPINRRSLLAMFGLAGPAGALTVSVALTAGGTAHAGTTPTPADHFAVYRRAATASDVPTGGLHGQSANDTRRLDTGHAGWDAWAEVDGQLICVASFDGERQSYQQSPPRACAPAAIVDSSSRPLILETQIGNDWRATALAPDAVTAVQVNYADGSSEPVDVHGNGFHLKLRMQLLNITYTDASGSHTTEPASQ